MYPFRAQQLIGNEPHPNVIGNWRERYQQTQGDVLLVFEHRQHWLVLYATKDLGASTQDYCWTLLDGFRGHPHS